MLTVKKILNSLILVTLTKASEILTLQKLFVSLILIFSVNLNFNDLEDLSAEYLHTLVDNKTFFLIRAISILATVFNQI